MQVQPDTLVAPGAAYYVVNTLRSSERSMVVITHYQRLLDYIVPDFVHVLADGKTIRSGDKSLALELEQKGYSWTEDHASAA